MSLPVLVFVGVFVGLLVVAGALVIWLTGRDEPPRRED
jgi:hypothetical protein